MDKSTGKAIMGFIFGAAVGVAAGLLFAPSSGTDTRKKLEKKTKEYSDELARTVTRKIDDLKDYVEELGTETRAKLKKTAPEVVEKIEKEEKKA